MHINPIFIPNRTTILSIYTVETFLASLAVTKTSKESTFWSDITASPDGPAYHNNECMCAHFIASFLYDHYQYFNIFYTTRNLPIASIAAFAFDKMVCASGINIELAYAGVPDVEAIALVTGTYPSPP